MKIMAFLVTAGAVSFLTAAVLAIYESMKEGGYNRENSRRIVWFSIVFGVLVAASLGGWIGRTYPFPY